MLRVRAARLAVAAALLSVASVTLLAQGAAGEESLSDLRARMDAIQGELDATTERIEALRTEQEHLRERIGSIELRMADLEQNRSGLEEVAEERANVIYRQGSLGFAEAMFEARDLSELLQRAEVLSRVAQQNNSVFVRLARTTEELDALSAELELREQELGVTTADLDSTIDELRDKFASVADEYKELKEKLAAAREAEAAEAAEAAPPAAGSPQPPAPSGSGKVCPVAGPVSFVDSWGAPRVGHTHVGVDMMADYGTPLVAIVSGTITHSGWSDTGGNMLFLSGDDGNTYWYLHNQQNLVSSGHVQAGQQIATVGDTGNATGIPHLHFEYHPGGGGPVNPYPLVAAIC